MRIIVPLHSSLLTTLNIIPLPEKKVFHSGPDLMGCYHTSPRVHVGTKTSVPVPQWLRSQSKFFPLLV